MKLSKVLSILLLCVLVIGFAASCNDTKMVSSVPTIEQQEIQYGNSPPSNSYDVGRVVELDGYIYYAEGDLSKVKLDGTERTVHRKEWSSIYYLNVYKDWIYCVLTFEYNPEKDGIYRLSKDLSQCELIESGRDLGCLLIYGDDMYYLSESGALCRCKVDGSETTVILEQAGRFQPYGDWIYLVIRENDPQRPLARPKLYRVKNDGTGFELFLDTEMSSFYIYENKVLYNDFLDSNRLYRMDLDTKEKEKIVDDNVNSFFYKDNNIYYRNLDDMYACNLENGSTVKISKTLAWQEAIVGDYLYFQTSARYFDLDRICIKDGVIGEQTKFIERDDN